MTAGPIDLKSIAKQHAKFIKTADRAVDVTLQDAGEFAQDHVKQYSKFKRRKNSPRSLKDATKWKLKPRRRKNKTQLLLSSRKRYAGFIEFGTRPHIIRPRRAKALRFMVGLQEVFARLVHHPGTRPYKFLYRATSASYRWMSPKLTKRLQRVAARKYR